MTALSRAAAPRLRGGKIDLSTIADQPPLEGARTPSVSPPGADRSVPLGQVAPNPRNPRDVHAQPEKIAALAESIQRNGQLQPCTVVTRPAFLAIFPEHLDGIGEARFVQVTGGRRHAAITLHGLPTIKISVDDGVASSRAAFLAATTAENIDREDYDVIEEATAVQDIVREAGSGKAAAEQLGRTAPWVTQRLNLLKLEPELQAALRSGMPVREARDLHSRPREGQLAALQEWQRALAARDRADDARLGAAEEGQPDDGISDRPPRPRRTRIAVAIERLGGTPAAIALSLRAELSLDDRHALAAELLREDETADAPPD